MSKKKTKKTGMKMTRQRDAKPNEAPKKVLSDTATSAGRKALMNEIDRQKTYLEKAATALNHRNEEVRTLKNSIRALNDQLKTKEQLSAGSLFKMGFKKLFNG